MPPDQGHVPPGKVTAFNRAEYDNLIRWIDSVDRDLNARLNRPRPGVRRDETLGGGIYPGSSKWPPAANYTAKAKVFGKSAVDRYAELSKDWEQFVLALRDARDVFESTDNLNRVSATKFVHDHPGVLPSTNGGPSPSGSPSPSGGPPPKSSG